MAAETASRTRKALFDSNPALLVALVVAALYFGRDIFIPLAMALILSFLLTPLADRAESRLHLRRTPSVILVAMVAFGCMAIIGWVVAAQLITVVDALPNYRDNIQAKIDAIHAPAKGPLAQAVRSIQEISNAISSGAPQIAPAPAEQLPSFRRMTRTDLEKEIIRLHAESQASLNKGPTPVVVVPPPVSETAYLGSILLPVVKPVGILAAMLVFTVYMLLRREDLRNRVLLLAGVSHINVMSQALDDAAERISRYLRMNVMVNAGFGVVIGVGLYLLHVPNATLWGVLAGLMRMVPYFGIWVAGSATFIFTLAVFPGWWHPLFVAMMLVAIELLISNFFEPWFYGSHTGVSSLALLVSAIVWTILWGWAGLILSTPLTVCLIVIGQHIPQLRFLHILLGDDAELEPEAALYERLLAMDQAEARTIAYQYLRERSLLELYDGVLLPALVLAEQDRHKGDLDEVRTTYVHQSIAEIVAEVAEHKPAWPPSLETEMQRAPALRCGPVVCVAASDYADELAAGMMAQLLERAGRDTLLLPSNALSPEILERLALERDTVLCLSALPPFAFAHARALCLQLRQQMPHQRIAVGLWNEQDEAADMQVRFGKAAPSAVFFTMREAMIYLLGCDSPRAAN
jgi:predicted PurR-regulated permease PerM